MSCTTTELSYLEFFPFKDLELDKLNSVPGTKCNHGVIWKVGFRQSTCLPLVLRFRFTAESELNQSTSSCLKSRYPTTAEAMIASRYYKHLQVT